MSQLRTVWRLLRTFWRYRLDRLLPAEPISNRPIRTLLKAVQRIGRTRREPDGVRLRQALLDLGPVYIKLGQLMSTRRDLLPAEVADALAQLQDNVGPIADFNIHQFTSDALSQPWQDVFSHIDAAPLASASIAQVHRATLCRGDAVVIKVVRPGIGAQIDHDMTLLVSLCERAQRWLPELERLHLPNIMRDHHTVLMCELDMFHEARNQIQLRRNFAESDLLYVPRVEAELTRAQLLVMEFVEGVPISHTDVLEARGVDLKKLAHKGVETFFTQVFEDNFFHADMHPGNILVDCKDPANPRYIALDCAIIGSLTREDQVYLARNLQAFFQRDYRRVASLFYESGWIPADTDLEAFERVIKEVCDPIFAQPLAEISFGDFVVQLFRAAGQFRMEMQPQLALLQKTLLYIEGLGRNLYPQLDLWETAAPFIERWVAEHLNPLNHVVSWFNDWLSNPTPPGQREAQLRAHLGQQTRALQSLRDELGNQQRRRSLSRIAGLGLIGVSIVLLWQPLGAMVISGETGTLAGLVGALWGSALIMRA